MNTVVLMGRLTRDPELRYLQSGGSTAIARFSLAVDKNLSREKRQEMESKGQPTADFINCQAWGRLGENIAKYSGKGLRVIVEGRIQTGSYEKDGQRIYTTDVVASNVEFLDWKDSNSSNNTNYSNNQNFQSNGNQNNYSNNQNNPNNQNNSNNQNNQSNDFNQGFEENFEYSADFDPTEDKRIPF